MTEPPWAERWWRDRPSNERAQANWQLKATPFEGAIYGASLLREILKPGIDITTLGTEYSLKQILAFTHSKSLESTITKDAGQPSDTRGEDLGCPNPRADVNVNSCKHLSSAVGRQLQSCWKPAAKVRLRTGEKYPVSHVHMDSMFTSPGWLPRWHVGTRAPVSTTGKIIAAAHCRSISDSI